MGISFILFIKVFKVININNINNINNIKRTSSVSDRFIPSDKVLKNNEKYDILIIDEMHTLRKDDIRLLKYGKLVVALGDELQRIGNNPTFKNLLTDAKFENGNLTIRHLWSQFRCNKDEGYVSWVEQILGMNPTKHAFITGQKDTNDKIYISDLDFNIKLHNSDKRYACTA